MDAAPSRDRRHAVLAAVLAVGTAVCASYVDPAIAPRVALVFVEACAGRVCTPPTPQVPLFALLSGGVFGLVVLGSSWRAVLVGTAVGLGSALAANLFAAVSISQTNPYVAPLYRGYALAYAGAAIFALAAIIAGKRLARMQVSWPIGASLALAIGTATVRGQWPVAGMAVLAAAAGIAAGTVWSRRGSIVRPDPRAVAIAIAIAAFVARAAFGLQTLARTGPGMDFAIGSDDGDSYYQLARLVAAGQWGDVLGGVAFPPAYAVFVGLVFGATGESMAVVILFQALLAAGSTLVVNELGRLLHRPATGLIAAAFFALDGNLIQNQSTLTAEALLIPSVLVGLYSLSRYARTDGAGWLVLGAAALGLAFVTRNVAAMPLVLAALFWLGWRRRREIPLLARDVGVVVAALMIASLPIAAATYLRDGSPRMTTQLANLAWVFDGGPGYTVSNTFLVQRGIMPFEDPLGTLIRFVRDPLPVVGFYAVAAPQRFVTLMFSTSPGITDPLLIVNPVHLPNLFGDAITLLRIGAAAAALALAVRARSWRSLPEAGLVLGYVVLYIGVFTFVFPPYHAFRYRIPVEPFHLVAQAAGLVLVWEAVRHRSPTSTSPRVPA